MGKPFPAGGLAGLDGYRVGDLNALDGVSVGVERDPHLVSSGSEPGEVVPLAIDAGHLFPVDVDMGLSPTVDVTKDRSVGA